MCHQGLFLSQSLVVFKEFINVRQVEFEPRQQNQKPACKQEYPTKQQQQTNKKHTNTHAHTRARARAHTHTHTHRGDIIAISASWALYDKAKRTVSHWNAICPGKGRRKRSPLTSWAFFRWSLSSQNLVRKATLGSHTLFCRGTETEGERAATTDGGWNRRSPVELKASDL